MITASAMEDMAKWAQENIGKCKLTFEDANGKITVSTENMQSSVTVDPLNRTATLKCSSLLRDKKGLTIRKAEITNKFATLPVCELEMKRKISSNQEMILFSMTITEHGWHGESMDWLSEIVSQGKQADFFEAGETVTTKWTDSEGTEYEDPFVVVDVECSPELEDGSTVHGMMLQQKYLVATTCPFDPQEAFLDSEAGLAPGTYHFTVAGSTFLAADRGRQFQFTLTKTLPAGGQLVFKSIGGYSIRLAGQVLISYASATSFTELENVTLSEGSGGTDLGATDGAGDLNPSLSAFFGKARWRDTMMRQWLNSASPAGEWWAKQGKWDRSAPFAFENTGYMAGFPEDFLKILHPVKVKTHFGVEDIDETFDIFFPLSMEQMNYAPYFTDEGSATQYWINQAKAETNLDESGRYKASSTIGYDSLIFYVINDHELQTDNVLRSTDNSTNFFCATRTDGTLGTHGARTTTRLCAPACVICGRNEEG